MYRPRYDPATHYLFYWSGFLVDEAKKRNVRTIDLSKEKAKKDKFHSYLLKQPVDIVILNGHGNSEEVAGQNDEVLLSVSSGAKLMKGKNIFIRACDAATTLGQEIMKMGATGFVGYTRPFWIARDVDSFNRPLEDETAGPILRCSNQVGLSLIKGKPIAQAQEDSLARYRENIDKYSASETTSSFLLPFLLCNMTSQVCNQ